MKLPKVNFDSLEQLLFYTILCVFLYPIWSNAYFLTGDGPCHIYNAKVLLDFVQSVNVDFYSEYYELNENTEPNWFSHVTLAGLLTVFPDYLAEKILLTSYVLLFGFLFRGILFQINPKSVFLSLVGLPFMFHTTFQMGFYNYSFGFVFCFLSIWYWLKNQDRMNVFRTSIFILINILLYFTHPVGFLVSGLLIGSIPLSKFISNTGNGNSQVKTMLWSYLKILIGFLPGILLMVEYFSRKGLNPTPSSADFAKLFNHFTVLSSLVVLNNREGKWAMAIAILFALILVYSIYRKLQLRKLTRYDGFFAAFIILTLVYFNQPGTLAGAGILHKRFQFIPYLVVLIWFANIHFQVRIKWIITLACVIIITGLSIIRIPNYALASVTLEEYLSVRDYIEDRSTVLPLSFSHNGKTPEGKPVADRVWLYMHAFDYVGSDKSLVLFGNYEANTGYFPIVWKENRNPYLHLSSGDGLEALPPGVDIEKYELLTGGSVDYVVTWCLDDFYMEHPNTKNLLKELNTGYKLIFTSEHGLAQVYKKQS